MLIVFIGPPGAGKGTQCERLADCLGILHLSTGEILRRAKQDGTPLGGHPALDIDNGGLAPDSLVVELVVERLQQPECQPGCLLDGYPRTQPQAEALDEYLARENRRIDLALELYAPEDVLIQRLLQRASQSESPRADDTIEAIPRRMEIYHLQTEPLLEYYRQRNLLRSVDGTGTPDEVFERVRGCVDEARDVGR